MNKFYVLIVVGLLYAVSGIGQDFYWIGADDANWNVASNWSNSVSGTPAASDYPGQTSPAPANPANDRVILRGAEKISLNADISINAMLVTNAANAVITGIGGTARTLTVTSTNSGTPGLQIDAGAKLENNAADLTEFFFEFVENGLGTIFGEWYFTGNVYNDAYSLFILPSSTGNSTRINVNNDGKISVGANGLSPVGDDTYLVFNSGSTLHLMNSDQPFVPKANYDANSNILITGVTTNPILFDEQGSIGNLTYDCPGQINNQLIPHSLYLLDIEVKGNLNILNTNNQELGLMAYSQLNVSSNNLTINGDLNIQGNSRVTVSYMNSNIARPGVTINLTVLGDIIANGNSFSIQSSNLNHDDKATTLFVKGDIQHTAGTFNALSSIVNDNANLFVIEMNGSAPQTISSHNGSFDNTAHQVALRINNDQGVTLLSPLSIGRLDFNTAEKGVITTTSSNALTITNTANTALALGSPSDEGYVSGPVRRRSVSTDTLELPAGKAGLYRPVFVAPSSSDETVFEGTYFNSTHPDPSVLSPLQGLAPYYWEVKRISGTADGAVKLTLHGAISGAEGDDAIIAVKYNGIDWSGARSTGPNMYILGDRTSGFVVSAPQSTFSFFTLGFGLQAALPTTLVSFTARKTADATAKLNWKITDNSTPEVFEVMRSTDGVNFSKIGTVAGFADKFNYEFTDAGMQIGNNYYRLRMLDIDGTAKLSTILVVMNGSKGLVISSMQPTVVRDRTKLNINSSEKGNMQLVVTDISGRIIQTQSYAITTGNQEIWLNANRLSAGIFQVTGYFNGVRTATLRFIKQ